MAVTPSPSPSVSVGSWYNPHKGAGAPASTLGNVGDTYFDTTNNVYYVKGTNGWQTTQGSTQSIPAASSSNRYQGLYSNGGQWQVGKGAYYRQAALSPSIAGGQFSVPLFKADGWNHIIHFSCIIQLGEHEHFSDRVIVELVRDGTAGDFRGTLTIIPAQTLRASQSKMTYALTYKDYTVYLTAKGCVGNQWCMYTITNRIGDGDCLEVDSVDPIASTDLTEMENVTQHTVVPISTAANQMLVSDGNGGWKVLAAGAVGTTLKMTSDGPAWST